MTDIPADVMQAARVQCDLCGITPHSDMRVHAEHVAAFAIIAERESMKQVVKEIIANSAWSEQWDVNFLSTGVRKQLEKIVA